MVFIIFLRKGSVRHGIYFEGSAREKKVEKRWSRRSFMPAAWKLLNDLSELGIRVAIWALTIDGAQSILKSSILRVFISRSSTRLLGMDFPKTSRVWLNCLRTGVGRFHLSKYKWGLAPLSNCKCGATEQTADHVISSCSIHRAL